MRGIRVHNKELKSRITYATDAAELIKSGYKVGMSGFTGSGYPKLVPQALAEHIHPDYRPMLKDYYFRALNHSPGKHTPHLIEEAFSWHTRYMRTGSMKG